MTNAVLPYLYRRYADSIKATKERANEELGRKTTFGDSFQWGAEKILEVVNSDAEEIEKGSQLVGLGVFLLQAMLQAGMGMALESAAAIPEQKVVN